MGEPTSGLIVKLAWSSDQLSAGTNEFVTIELQDSSGRTVALMTVPEDQLHQEISRTFKHSVQIFPDGLISVFLEESVLELGANKAIAIDQVIAEAVSPEMLEDEPEAAQMLFKFRDRLLKSLEHVEKAITSLQKG